MYLLRNLLLPGLMILLIAGCATNQQKAEISQFDLSLKSQRNVALNAGRDTDYSKLSPYDQYTVCSNLMILRRYAHFDHCITDFRNTRLSAGKLQMPGGGLAKQYANMDLANLMIYSLMAQAELGKSDIQKARHYAQKALNAYNGQPTVLHWLTDKPMTSYVDNYRTYYIIPIFGVFAITEGLQGNKRRAIEYIEKIKQVDLSCLACSNYISARKTFLSRAYFAINDIQAAHQILTSNETNADSVLMGLITAVNRVNPAYYALNIFTGFDLDDVDNMKTYEQRAMLCRANYLLNKSEAYTCYENILDNELTPVYGAVEFLALQDLAALDLEKGRAEKARTRLSRAIELLEEQRSTLSTDTHKMGFISDKLGVYQDMIAILFEQQKYDQAFAFAERAKARALVDMLASKKQFKSDGRSGFNQDGSLISNMSDAEQNLNMLGRKATSKQRSDSRQQLLSQRQQFVSKQPELASLVAVSSPDIKALQRLLPADETLLEFYGSEKHLYAFVLTHDGVTGKKLTIPDLEKQINAYREALQGSTDSYRQLGIKLYKQLIKPLAGHLSASSKLTVVPHGVLHYLPFAAIYTGNDFLIDRYQLRVLPSASVLQFLKSQSAPREVMLVLGNPDLDNPEMDLPGAQAEAVAIARRTPGADLLLRRQATETAIKKHAAGYRYLHFASHGTFNNDKPLASALLLSKDSENDGLLTVAELYDLKLNADLVTLSACETALGETKSGDDVVGFTRGFLYAGASSIVSTLWQIDDAATNLLMQNFYSHLRQGKDKRSALRAAQLKVKNEYGHPYYWAAFQLTGRS